MFWIDKIMKNLILILMFCTFLISCQTEAQSENSNFTEVVKNTNEPIQTQFETSPSDSAKADVKNSKIGIIQSGKQGVCLKIQNSNLNVGEKIQVVIPRLPQKSVETEISDKSACKEENFGDLYEGDITDYLLKSSDAKILNLGYGIGIVTAQKVQMNGNFATRLILMATKKSNTFVNARVWKVYI